LSRKEQIVVKLPVILKVSISSVKYACMQFDKLEFSFVPHYTIRSFESSTDSFIISFRILREQENGEVITSLIRELIKRYDHEIDPKTGTMFSNFHMWIRHGQENSKWTKERCQILSMISRFVLEIIKSDTRRDDKEEWTHLFSNMAGVFELFKIYHSPETILNPDTTQYRVLRYG
jgi:hypothetical protein